MAEAQQRPLERKSLSVRWVYVLGLIGWVVIWTWMFAGPRPKVWVDAIDALYLDHYWVLGIPLGIGIIALVVNLVLWWKPGSYAEEYDTEVKVIEFVERN